MLLMNICHNSIKYVKLPNFPISFNFVLKICDEHKWNIKNDPFFNVQIANFVYFKGERFQFFSKFQSIFQLKMHFSTYIYGIVHCVRIWSR